MRIILAIDGSEQSGAAAAAVIAQRWPARTRIRLLTVVHGIYRAEESRGGASPTFWNLIHEVNEDALRLIVRTATLLRDAGVSVEIAVTQGDPRPAIVEEARVWSADLVVLGSQGKTATSTGFLGSVAEYVLINAECLVDIVPLRSRRKRTNHGLLFSGDGVPGTTSADRGARPTIVLHPTAQGGDTPPQRLH